MRYSLVAALAVAISVTAVAQDQPASASGWQTFGEEGGRSGALVKADNGSQIVIKCDKPGKREVHAMIMSANDKLAVPNDRPISRPIRFQFDNKSPATENWRFYETYAMASGKTGDRALARFIVGLRNASKVRTILSTGIGSDVDLSFDVAGAQKAIAHVYEACRDSAPA
ncbi:MAG TPA: hypothetical protein VNR60_08065 [Croceibacterium sp.]|nr:hypothetical protein [Croceibacterium sp.]